MKYSCTFALQSRDCKNRVTCLKSMSNRIRHSGIVEEVWDNCVKVRILQTSACAGCKVAGHCNASESKEKTVEVIGSGMTGRYSKGDNVIVSVSSDMGMKAVGLAFVIPFVILLAVIFIIDMLVGDEVVSAIVGVCSLIPYYILLYAFKERIGKSFVFTLES